MTLSPPERIELDDPDDLDAVHLRWLTVDDADAIARAVGESLEHLRPWMPWADAQSAEPGFQRRRLAAQVMQRERGEEWQYGVFDADDVLLGTVGLMTRRGPGKLEIGYWLHVEHGNHGYATRAARALTDIGLQMDGIDQLVIMCDEANTRSAAVPQRLGYSLARVEQRPPEAPGETGHMQVWVRGPTP